MARRWREAPHLARRFVRALRPPTPGPADEAWVRSLLRPQEHALWAAQATVDRAHTIAVARAVARDAATAAVAGPPPGWLVPAALLHDVGKADAALGPIGRALATGLELVGLDRAPGRLGRYLRYPETGAAQLRAAGADPLVVDWAREHHAPPASWTVPAPWAALLAAADRTAG
jgi:cell wall-associated NlpC family hydrolase